MKVLMRILGAVGLFLFIFFLSSYIANHTMGIFNPQGIIALAEKNLIIKVFTLMSLVIVPVYIMLFVFAWRYRVGTKHARYTPDWNNNTVLEVIWWLIPAGIILALSIITWKTTHELDPYRPIDSTIKPVTIEVIALDWKWLFIYPEEHIATVNYIMLPKDTPINFKITADAPMNAFWIPQLGGQVYAMAGMTAKLHLLATEIGDYKGVSSNFSGDGFSGMKFVVHVAEGAEYVQWINSVRASSSTFSFDEYEQLAKQSKNNPVTYYASVPEAMYTTIINKYMFHGNHNVTNSQELIEMIPRMNTH